MRIINGIVYAVVYFIGALLGMGFACSVLNHEKTWAMVYGGLIFINTVILAAVGAALED